MTTPPPASSLPPGLKEALADIARRHGFTPDAAVAMLDALRRAGGNMAQFSHPEFGGAGQWMRGGMTMVADLFNQQLAARVDGLASQLGEWLANHPDLQPRAGSGGPASPWWPDGLGQPSTSGTQDGMRYAWFADAQRLAVDAGGRVTVYDTGEHRIGGVAQQQGSGSGAGLSFTSQHGPVDLATLRVVTGADATTPSPAPTPAPTPAATPPAAPSSSDDRSPAHTPAAPDATPAHRPRTTDATPAQAHGHDALLATIEKLSDLHARGILTAEEYASKKADLLGRL